MLQDTPFLLSLYIYIYIYIYIYNYIHVYIYIYLNNSHHGMSRPWKSIAPDHGQQCEHMAAERTKVTGDRQCQEK